MRESTRQKALKNARDMRYQTALVELKEASKPLTVRSWESLQRGESLDLRKCRSTPAGGFVDGNVLTFRDGHLCENGKPVLSQSTFTDWERYVKCGGGWFRPNSFLERLNDSL